MGIPPAHLLDLIETCLITLLRTNPLATSSEAFVRETVELSVVKSLHEPRYGLRIGINYHGQMVQQIALDAEGHVIGWNPNGEWGATRARAKMRLGGYTIFPRNEDEHSMSDAKFYGGDIPDQEFVRCEFKVRGWLGKTRNLDGGQLLKDFELLAQDYADLLVICLSEVAYRKWRGEGNQREIDRRIGLIYFSPVLQSIEDYDADGRLDGEVEIDTPTKTDTGWRPGQRQRWAVRRTKVIASPRSVMPGAEHYVILCWRPPPNRRRR